MPVAKSKVALHQSQDSESVCNTMAERAPQIYRTDVFGTRALTALSNTVKHRHIEFINVYRIQATNV